MPTIEENRAVWDGEYRWDDQGEEWSQAWGGPEAQWFGAIFPRIHAFVPAPTILELGPGFGRWTHFLKGYCRRLILVDLSERCIEACRARFAARADHLEYHVNDGKSLAAVDDGSVDFVFSFDSLVHAEADIIQGYLEELSRKLQPQGVAFLHHSNLGEYTGPNGAGLPADFQNVHWRSRSVSAGLFKECAERAGFVCLSQEILMWGDVVFNDCISVIARADSAWNRTNRIVRNSAFGGEAEHVRQWSALYTGYPPNPSQT